MAWRLYLALTTNSYSYPMRCSFIGQLASFWPLEKGLVDLELSGLLGSVAILEGDEDGIGVLPREPGF